MHWSRNTIKYKYFSQVSLHLGSEAVSANSFKLNAGGAEYTRFVSGRTKMEPCGSSARAHFPHAPKTTQRRDHNNSTNPVRRPNSATPRPPRCSRTEPRTSPSRSRWCPSRGRCLPDRRTERRPPGGTRSAGRRADGSRYNWVRRRLLLLSRPCAFACVCACVWERYTGFMVVVGFAGGMRRSEGKEGGSSFSRATCWDPTRWRKWREIMKSLLFGTWGNRSLTSICLVQLLAVKQLSCHPLLFY